MYQTGEEGEAARELKRAVRYWERATRRIAQAQQGSRGGSKGARVKQERAADRHAEALRVRERIVQENPNDLVGEGKRDEAAADAYMKEHDGETMSASTVKRARLRAK